MTTTIKKASKMLVKDVLYLSGDNMQLSEQIIPSIANEFYSYSTIFSVVKPLYFLMKCKAQKNRSLDTETKYLEKEHDLTFIFGDDILLCSPDSLDSVNMMEKYRKELPKYNHTDIKICTMSKSDFYHCYTQKDKNLLVEIYNIMTNYGSEVILSNDLILSIKTKSNKYGLILIKKITPTSCEIDACHILLK